MGECFRCRAKAREDLFLSHVKQVATYVRTKSPVTTPIIWDDMLRHLPVSTMQLYDIGKLVEPMVTIVLIDSFGMFELFLTSYFIYAPPGLGIRRGRV